MNHQNPTKRNHYIPCFWSAFWNSEYYLNETIRNTQKPRNQLVHSLNLKGDVLLLKKTNDIFWEKGMGLATMSDFAIKEFERRRNSDEFNQFLSVERTENTPVGIDFENFFTAYENISREYLITVILKNNIDTLEEKTQIASFLVDLVLRNPINIKKLVSFFQASNSYKFELFYNIKQAYSDEQFHFKMIIPLISKEWILYNSNKFLFPLSENPILMNNKNLLIALSPKLLLRINLKKSVVPEKVSTLKRSINYFLYQNFLKRTILSASREIIFCDSVLLKKIQKSRNYKQRKKQI